MSDIKDGGITRGPSHQGGGIRARVKATGEWIELEGGEGVINKKAMSSDTIIEIDGKEMTLCEAASYINEKTGGKPFSCNSKNEHMELFALGGRIQQLSLTPEFFRRNSATIHAALQDNEELLKGYRFVKEHTKNGADWSEYENDEFIATMTNNFFAYAAKWIQKNRPELLKEDVGYTGHKYTGPGYKATKGMHIKDIAKMIKEEILIYYPDIKVSVKTGGGVMTSSINANISGLPFNPFAPDFVEMWKEGKSWEQINDHFHHYERYNEEYIQMRDRIKAIGEQYNYNDTDSQIDYFDNRYYFFERIDTDDWLAKINPEHPEVLRKQKFEAEWAEREKQVNARRDKIKAEFKDKLGGIIPKYGLAIVSIMFRGMQERQDYPAFVTKSIKPQTARAGLSYYSVRFLKDDSSRTLDAISPREIRIDPIIRGMTLAEYVNEWKRRFAWRENDSNADTYERYYKKHVEKAYVTQLQQLREMEQAAPTPDPAPEEVPAEETVSIAPHVEPDPIPEPEIPATSSEPSEAATVTIDGIEMSIPEAMEYLAQKLKPKFEEGGVVEAGPVLERSFHVRDTLVDKTYFNMLPEGKRREIMDLANQFHELGYVDARTEIGPDQQRRMSAGQREKMSDIRVQAFEIENKIKQLLKADNQVAAEEKFEREKHLLGRKSQLERQIADLEHIFSDKLSSPKDNGWKRAHQMATMELAEIDEKLSTGKFARGGSVGSEPAYAVFDHPCPWMAIPDYFKYFPRPKELSNLDLKWSNKDLMKVLLGFIVKDKILRPNIHAINFSEHGATATDGSILVNMPGKPEKLGLMDPEGKLVDEKFPNYPVVVPKQNPHKYKVSVEKIYCYCQTILETKLTSEHTQAIKFRYNGSSQIGLNAKYVMQVCEYWMKRGYKELYLHMSEPNRATIWTREPGDIDPLATDYVLLMPLMLDEMAVGSTHRTSYSGDIMTVTDIMGAANLDFARKADFIFDLQTDGLYTTTDGSNRDHIGLEVPLKKPEHFAGTLTVDETRLLASFAGKKSVSIVETVAVFEDGTAMATDLETELRIRNSGLPSGIYYLCSGAFMPVSSGETLTLEDYPKLRSIIGGKTAIMSSWFLESALEAAIPHLGKDEFRPAMMCAKMIFRDNQEVEIVSTNSFTLSRQFKPAEVREPMTFLATSVEKVYKALSAMPSTAVYITAGPAEGFPDSENYLVEDYTGRWVVVSRQGEGTYPGYEGLFRDDKMVDEAFQIPTEAIAILKKIDKKTFKRVTFERNKTGFKMGIVSDKGDGEESITYTEIPVTEIPKKAPKNLVLAMLSGLEGPNHSATENKFSITGSANVLSLMKSIPAKTDPDFYRPRNNQIILSLDNENSDDIRQIVPIQDDNSDVKPLNPEPAPQPAVEGKKDRYSDEHGRTVKGRRLWEKEVRRALRKKGVSASDIVTILDNEGATEAIRMYQDGHSVKDAANELYGMLPALKASQVPSEEDFDESLLMIEDTIFNIPKDAVRAGGRPKKQRA